MKVWDDLSNLKKCPIEVAMSYLGKKWTMQIIRDLFKGKKRFSEFLISNPQISTKMLSLRLKELKKSGLIEKKIYSSTPVIIEYSLTQKGESLNKILFQLAEFSLKNYSNEIYNQKPKSVEKDILSLKKFFKVNNPVPISYI